LLCFADSVTAIWLHKLHLPNIRIKDWGVPGRSSLIFGWGFFKILIINAYA
jgi:hypothetical protein